MATETSTDSVGTVQQRRWLLLLLVVLAAAVGTKLFFDRRWAPEAADMVVVAAAPELVASAPASAVPPESSETEAKWGQPGLAAERVGRAASAALATARAAAGLAPQPPAEVVVELCGVGRMTLPVPVAGAASAAPAEVIGSLWPLPAPLGRWAIDAAWPRVLQAMEEGSQPDKVRAAALVLRAAGVPGAADSGADGSLAAHRKLVAMARTSADPLVMRWALSLCQRTGRPAECRRISSKDLARLAPDDTYSWLDVAASDRATPADKAAALNRAAQAPRWDDAKFQLVQALDSAWPADLPEYLRLELLVQAIGIEAAFPDQTGFAVYRQMCSADALQQPDARQRCETLARTQQAGAKSLYTLGMAHALGKRLGWPQAELDAMRSEITALTNHAAALLTQTDQPYACSAVADTRQYIGSVATDGELQALRLRAATQPTAPKPANNRP